jgi:gluconate kinase
VIDREQCAARVHSRSNHFFAEPLLASQYAALEPPDPAESRVYPVPTGEEPAGQLTADIIAMLGLHDQAGRDRSPARPGGSGVAPPGPAPA